MPKLIGLVKKVKAFHTHYRALSLELIPVHRCWTQCGLCVGHMWTVHNWLNRSRCQLGWHAWADSFGSCPAHWKAPSLCRWFNAQQRHDRVTTTADCNAPDWLASHYITQWGGLCSKFFDHLCTFSLARGIRNSPSVMGWNRQKVKNLCFSWRVSSNKYRRRCNGGRFLSNHFTFSVYTRLPTGCWNVVYHEPDNA